MSGPTVLSKRSSPASPKAGILQPNRRLLSGASWLCNAISGERRSGHEVWTVTSVSAAAWCLAAAHGPQNCLLKRRGAAAVPSQAPGAGAGCCRAAARAPPPALGLRKHRPDMTSDGVTPVRSCTLTQLPGADRPDVNPWRCPSARRSERLCLLLLANLLLGAGKKCPCRRLAREEKPWPFAELPSPNVAGRRLKPALDLHPGCELSRSAVCVCFSIYTLFPGCLGISLVAFFPSARPPCWVGSTAPQRGSRCRWCCCGPGSRPHSCRPGWRAPPLLLQRETRGKSSWLAVTDKILRMVSSMKLSFKSNYF